MTRSSPECHRVTSTLVLCRIPFYIRVCELVSGRCEQMSARVRKNMLGEIRACLRRNVEIAQKHSTGNSFLLICPGGNLDCAGFQGREEGAGWMLWLLRGAQSHRWTWPGAYADRTLYVSLHFSARSPARVHRRPERNINHPNSICGSRSYFLDEQCRHFCVMDDEHAGIACC